MTYSFNHSFRLGRRAIRSHGDVHYVARDDAGGQTLVLDDRSRAVVEALLSGAPFVPGPEDIDVLKRLAFEGIVTSDDEPRPAPEPAVENLQLWLQTSDRCNLSCTYCYIPSLNSTRQRRPDLFSLLGEKLLAVKGLKSVSVKLAGGEPLLAFDSWADELITLRRQLDAAGIALHARLITNLTFLTRRIVDYFRKEKIGISVSLDGLAAFNDRNRIFPVDGRGSFQVVKKNLEVLRENGIKPGVMITATSENSPGIGDLVEALVQDDLVFRLSDAKGGHILPGEFEQAFEAMHGKVSKGIRTGYPASERIVISDLRTLSPQAHPCSMGTSGAAIYLDGSVYFCHTEFEKGQPLGNLEEDESLANIIRRGYARHLGLSADCRKCEFRFVCAGGCPLYRQNGKSPMCSAYKKIIPRIFDLYDEEAAHA